MKKSRAMLDSHKPFSIYINEQGEWLLTIGSHSLFKECLFLLSEYNKADKRMKALLSVHFIEEYKDRKGNTIFASFSIKNARRIMSLLKRCEKENTEKEFKQKLQEIMSSNHVSDEDEAYHSVRNYNANAG